MLEIFGQIVVLIANLMFGRLERDRKAKKELKKSFEILSDQLRNLNTARSNEKNSLFEGIQQTLYSIENNISDLIIQQIYLKKKIELSFKIMRDLNKNLSNPFYAITSRTILLLGEWGIHNEGVIQRVEIVNCIIGELEKNILIRYMARKKMFMFDYFEIERISEAS